MDASDRDTRVRNRPNMANGPDEGRSTRIPVDYYNRTGGFPSELRRVSWGAILGGAALALVVQLALNILGLAIGLGALNPATEADPLSGIGMGTGIWLALSTLIALFAGGWAAGRLAGQPHKTDGMLHGVISWAAVTFVTFYMVLSGAGMVVNGAMNVVQQGAQLLGQGAAAIAPAAAGAVGDQVDGDISYAQIEAEVRQILRQTGQEELQPENLSERARQAAETAQTAAGDAAASPEDAAQEIEAAFDQLVRQGREVIREADREAAVNVLMARTDMSRAEAQQTVGQYEDAIVQARDQIVETAGNIGETSVEAADQVAESMSNAAWWAFFAMVIGAGAAAAGGIVGARSSRDPGMAEEV